MVSGTNLQNIGGLKQYDLNFFEFNLVFMD